MRVRFLSVASVVLVGVFASVVSPAIATGGETYSLDDLPAVESTPGVEQVLILPEGQDFVIPEPGMEVRYEAIAAEGAPEVLEVLLVADEDGDVAARVGDELFGSAEGVEYLQRIEDVLDGAELFASLSEQTSPPSIQAAASPVKCTSADSAMLGHNWAKRLVEWQYNPTGQKGSDSAATLQRAANRWKGNLTGSCGNTGYSSLRTSYAGTTTRTPLPTSGGGCGAYAVALNTKGWGPLPSGTLAATCTYSIGAYPYRSDQKYNTSYAWNTGSSTACSGTRYDLQGVATHEFGHTFGLGHSQQANNQVMKPMANTCESAMRTLGRGDIRGISYLYG